MRRSSLALVVICSLLLLLSAVCFAFRLARFCVPGPEFGQPIIDHGGGNQNSINSKLLLWLAGSLVIFAIWDTLRRSKKLRGRDFNWLLVIAFAVASWGVMPVLTSVGPTGAIKAIKLHDPEVIGANRITQRGLREYDIYDISAKLDGDGKFASRSYDVDKSGFLIRGYLSDSLAVNNTGAVLPKPLTQQEAEEVAAELATRLYPGLSQLGSWRWKLIQPSHTPKEATYTLQGAVELPNGALTYPCFRAQVVVATGRVLEWAADPLTVPESALVTPTVTPEQAIQAAKASGAVTGNATAELRYLPGKELLYIVKEGSSFLWVGAQSGKVLRDSRQP